MCWKPSNYTVGYIEKWTNHEYVYTHVNEQTITSYIFTDTVQPTPEVQLSQPLHCISAKRKRSDQIQMQCTDMEQSRSELSLTIPCTNESSREEECSSKPQKKKKHL